MREVTKENLISGSMGIVLILTFLIIFTFMLCNQYERAILSLIFGMIIIVSSIVIYTKILKYPLKKAVISVVLGIAGCIVFFAIYLALLSSPSYFGNHRASYEYSITVQGLRNYNYNLGLDHYEKDGWFDFTKQSSNITTIMIPIPMRGGNQIFEDEELQNKSFGDWISTPVVTAEGKMLAFQTRNKNLTDIEARFKKEIGYSIDIVDLMYDALLYPSSDKAIAGSYPVRIHSDGMVQNYTTYIYIDLNIQPIKTDNNSITFILGFTVKNNTVFRKARNYQIDVIDAVPASLKGPIPVKAQIITVLNNMERLK